MNNKTLLTYFILIIAPLFFNCRGPIKGENKTNATTSSVSLHTDNEKYVRVDTKQSVITWKGSSLNGLNSQTGYVYPSKGELMIENGQLMGGTVEIDMNTIEDKRHESDNKLVNHLKDPDFFEVEKFPFSIMSITKIKSMTSEDKQITGNLTIKGITHPVTFPAKLEMKDGIVKANGKLMIDRTQWDVRYKSAKFYTLLANQTMSDSIEFHINIVAKNK
ncbi:YceI family protein [Siphonobacter sp. SORGH_AS_0500]|uniref:YceI family protein n=1 Tax=Siphonobacter sp. SORGH_AS_0500 TaxID=1864824 RepID=UPI002862EA36|nr:YceI family protein [Siphonobacter sp. SORGH_AS_0500]MDR6195099.1 polyisoprenoid-binding protein YceI [Siphonobacter sp. SORGH_AS_0500]